MIGRRVRVLLQIAAVGGLAAVALLPKPLWLGWNEHRARQLLGSRDSRALGHLQQSFRLDPERPETLFMLARANRRAGRFDRASALLRQAECLGGDSERAGRERLLILAQSGRLDMAESGLDDLLMDPRSDGPDICDAYAQGYLSNGRMEPARQLLNVWEKDYPNDPQCHFIRALMFELLDRWPEAADSYRRGLELAPRESAMRLRLASVLLEKSAAQQDGADIRYEMGVALLESGSTDAGVRWLRAALELAPNHQRAQEALARLYGGLPGP